MFSEIWLYLFFYVIYFHILFYLKTGPQQVIVLPIVYD